MAPTANQTSSFSDAGGILISATNTGTVASSPISAVGPTVTAYLGSAQTGISVPVSPKSTGDLMMMGVYTYGDGSPVPSSVSGGGVSSWSDESFCGYATGASLTIWWGVVSTTGASDINVSFATKAGSGVAFAQELSAGPSPTWSLDTSGLGTTKTTSSVPFPTLSPSGKGEAYFGLGFSYGQATAGTTAGYNYEVADQYGLGDGVLAFDPSVSSATAPAATESADAADAGAVLISASRLQGASYTYDQADRLSSAAVAGTGVVGYAYNGDGLLVASANSSGTATNTWDTRAGLPLLLSDGTNDYIYGPDGTPVEQAALGSGTLGYYLSDAQGSTRALLDANGAVAATFSYDAYGNLSSTSGAMGTPLLYAGQYQDTTTDLYYLRARWYGPTTTQFVSVDPMVASTGEPYVYAGDNPVMMTDPTGLARRPTNVIQTYLAKNYPGKGYYNAWLTIGAWNHFQGHWLDWNQSVALFLGKSPGETMGQTYEDLITTLFPAVLLRPATLQLLSDNKNLSLRYRAPIEVVSFTDHLQKEYTFTLIVGFVTHRIYTFYLKSGDITPYLGGNPNTYLGVPGSTDLSTAGLGVVDTSYGQDARESSPPSVISDVSESAQGC